MIYFTKTNMTIHVPNCSVGSLTLHKHNIQNGGFCNLIHPIISTCSDDIEIAILDLVLLLSVLFLCLRATCWLFYAEQNKRSSGAIIE